MKKCALVCSPSDSLENGLRLKYLGKVDVQHAKKQHAQYCWTLASLDYLLIHLPPDPEYPDSVFVEDPAVAFGDVLVRARLRRLERQGEEDRIERALRPMFSRFAAIIDPGFLEGGDVVIADSTLYIGLSGRTNIEGAEQLARIARNALGYASFFIEVPANQLHLKGAASYHRGRSVLTVREDITSQFHKGYRKKIVMPGEERFAANCITEGTTALVHASCPQAKQLLEKAGYKTIMMFLSEFEKVDGAMSCLSKLII